MGNWDLEGGIEAREVKEGANEEVKGKRVNGVKGVGEINSIFFQKGPQQPLGLLIQHRLSNLFF